MNELLENTDYAWVFIVGGTAYAFGPRVWFGLLALWTVAGLYAMHRYDPTPSNSDN